MILIDPNILWRTLEMGDIDLEGDKSNEIINLLRNKALNSFMGGYILLDNQSRAKYNISFIELLLRHPEYGCALGNEVLGEQFIILIRSILKGSEFDGIRDIIINNCNRIRNHKRNIGS
ncbi:hypothetical protein Calag_1211 [Caldisphaera lagunensis DSM 15908]|uniref:Uncharacterized protein n=1 Tax=Caldisphaera lagunensis (strain DSM 15908 / JCM 11604 / ANMR 0165 / IC-154) TaxID=1056495 RepID=L0AD00_CALLD|nr:hypothetical protein [Caldisphaera lagunensis]AFZ70930.1 hypothetical protein Calag_1211 [Caldisphaera lagunensis DSM 15908]